MNSILFGILLAIPLVNDFIFAGLSSNQIIAADFTLRLTQVLIIFILIKRHYILKSDLGLRRLTQTDLNPVLALGFLSAIGWLIGLLLLKFLPVVEIKMFTFGDYSNPAVKAFDLTLGLMLVAVTEEIIYRGALIHFLTRKLEWKVHRVCLTSVFLFGITHWGSGGLDNIVPAMGWALFPTYYAYYHRNTSPIILVHFIFNFLTFI